MTEKQPYQPPLLEVYTLAARDVINVSKNNTTFSSVDGILYDKEQTYIITVPLAISGSITIPDGVTGIGGSTFSGCGELTSISVSDNNENYKSIDGNLYDKSGTTLITYATGKTETLFVVPNGVTSIGDYAFYMCKGLTSVTMKTFNLRTLSISR